MDVTVGRDTDRVPFDQARPDRSAMGREPRREAAEGSRRGAVRCRHQGEHAANRQAAFDPAREMPRPQKLRQLTVVRRKLPGGGVGRGEQPGRERGPHQTPIDRPEVVQRWVVATRQRGVERAPCSPGQQHRRAEFGCRVQDFGGVWLICRRVPVFGVALAGHPEARDLERLAAACRPASTGGERLDEDLETLRVPKPTQQPLLAGGLQETGGVAAAQTRLQQGHDVRLAERIEPQHGQGFVRRHRPQALPVAGPEPVRRPTREPEPRPSEGIESPPNLVERGPRIALPGPDLVESVNEERLPGPWHRAGSRERAGFDEREEVAGRKEERVGPERLDLAPELGGLTRSRIAEEHERSRVAEGGERPRPVVAGLGDRAGYETHQSGATQCPAGCARKSVRGIPPGPTRTVRLRS